MLNQQNPYTLILPVITVIGTIVLIALHDLSAATGIALIAAITGTHVGAAVSGNTTVTSTPPPPAAEEPVFKG